MRKPAKKEPWSRDEDLTLVENVHQLNHENYTKFLPGRTIKAIRARIRTLGLQGAAATFNGYSYTTTELAAILGVPRRTLWRWVLSGMFKDVDRCPVLDNAAQRDNPEARYRIPTASVDEFLTEYPMLFSVKTFPPMQKGGVNHRQTLIEAMPDSWVTVPQAARILGWANRTVTAWAAEGKLPGRRVLGVWYFKRYAVEDLRVRRFRHDSDRSTRAA